MSAIICVITVGLLTLIREMWSSGVIFNWSSGKWKPRFWPEWGRPIRCVASDHFRHFGKDAYSESEGVGKRRCCKTQRILSCTQSVQIGMEIKEIISEDCRREWMIQPLSCFWTSFRAVYHFFKYMAWYLHWNF